MSSTKRVIIIGAGAGGLAAAMDLTSAGLAVTLIEQGDAVGGKMRQIQVDGKGIDAGPTVFTMRWIFEALFERSRADLASELSLKPATRLARHSWQDGSQLDLWADIDRSKDAIGAFSDLENATGYERFCADSRDVFETLKETFIAAQKPNPLSLGRRVGLNRIGALWRTRPFQTYNARLESYFSDPRLRQLFGRYATYVGSSPYLTPATLMLIAHVEQDGVWLVDGGMRAVAHAMADIAQRNGATIRLGERVKSIDIDRGKVRGVVLQTGEDLPADAIVFNGDASALGQGLLGANLTSAAPVTKASKRSSSALTWCTHAKVQGFDLDYHTVFFSDAYAREFDQVFKQRTVPTAPTVYICAQDRGEPIAPGERERLLILVNAPADGDQRPLPEETEDQYRHRVWEYLDSFGLKLERDAPIAPTGPSGFHTLFPGTGGALYGRANHGPFATFERAGAATSIKGLFLAGGSTHPGAGVPMATMSGRLAAEALLANR
ncbi:MAG: 1-hydroxycarotenoid 3,4-desaturase CrtD [Pseudomonadota bacterium]